MTVAVRRFDELGLALDAAGDDLSRANQPLIYHRAYWLKATRALVATSGNVRAYQAIMDDTHAYLFLSVSGNIATMLGSWYTLDQQPIFHPADMAEETKLLLLSAIALKMRNDKLASFTASPMQGPQSALLQTALALTGWHCETAISSWNWQNPIESADFSQFWAARPGQLRSTYKRRSKAARLTTTVYRDWDAQAWQAYENIYADSWKQAEGSPEFLRAIAMTEAAAGNLRVGIASNSEGRAIAAQFWLVENGFAVIHKLAHRTDSDALSPGTILSEALFRHVIEQDNVRCIDFGTGDDRYKADWMTVRNPLFTLSAVNPRTLTGLGKLAKFKLRGLVGSRNSD